jgi:hypothetical protein
VGAFIQISADLGVFAICGAGLPRHLRRLVKPRRVRWLPECRLNAWNNQPRLESERLRSSPPGRPRPKASGIPERPVRPTQHPTRDGPNGQVNGVIRINAPHTVGVPGGGNQQPFIMNADGTQQTQLTFGTRTTPDGLNNIANWGELRVKVEACPRCSARVCATVL